MNHYYILELGFGYLAFGSDDEDDEDDENDEDDEDEDDDEDDETNGCSLRSDPF